MTILNPMNEPMPIPDNERFHYLAAFLRHLRADNAARFAQTAAVVRALHGDAAANALLLEAQAVYDAEGEQS